MIGHFVEVGKRMALKVNADKSKVKKGGRIGKRQMEHDWSLST